MSGYPPGGPGQGQGYGPGQGQVYGPGQGYAPGPGGPTPSPGYPAGPPAYGPPAPQHAPAQAAAAFPCRSCGATLSYAPGTSVLRCPYCGSEQPVPTAPSYDDARWGVDGSIDELDYEAFLRSANKPTGVPTHPEVQCPRCHATVTTWDVSLPCPFCNAPIVIAVDSREQIVPEGIVPFRIDRNQAGQAMQKWTGSRWFAPGGLKKVTNPERINGTYVPHWTYDAQTQTHYTGMRGDYYYVTESYTDSDGNRQTREVRKTRWWPASGTVSRFFDDVLVIGSTQIAPKEVSKLEPWPLEGAEPFRPTYLAGYRTLRYDVQPEQGLQTAQSIMDGVIRDDIRSDIGGDEQQILTHNTRHWDLTFKLMLLPVWVAGYLYAGKTYTVYINAHDGHVVGERPYSVPKIVAAVLAGLLLLGLLGWWYVSTHAARTPSPSVTRRPSYSTTTRSYPTRSVYPPGQTPSTWAP